MTCAEAKHIDMVEYLDRMGFQPVRVRGNNFWYMSPFRDEKTASFKINRKINRWYDFGEGKGGNIIDFGIRYMNCTIREFLNVLSCNDISFPKSAIGDGTVFVKPEPKITILEDHPLRSYPLLNYLKERRIPLDIAEKFCREVNYKIGERAYYAIGFENNADGWELRNPYFKGSSSPKDIATFRSGKEIIAVFEGFFDMLSFVAIIEDANIGKRYDYLVLNSLALIERARKVMERYSSVYLFLDNDISGQHYTKCLLSLDDRYQDKSYLYKDHKDLNEWLCNTEKLMPQ